MNPWKQPASDSEPALSLDTTKDKYNQGSGSTSVCPRAGAIILETRRGAVSQVTTNCNTWSCVSCRDRNLRRFKAVVSSGCSTLGRCTFITITYKAGSKRLEAAGCVQRDWVALMRQLKKRSPWIKEMEYLRVTEMTAKGTPHIHAIFGTIPPKKKINCWKRGDFQVNVYRSRMESCDCFAHEVARAWMAVTEGESYICFAIAVTTAIGAGAYLGKYMGKDMFAAHGRRFQKSRGWPSDQRARLKSGPGGFKRIQWTKGGAPDDIALKWDSLERTGGAKRVEERKTAALKRLLRLGEKVEHTA